MRIRDFAERVLTSDRLADKLAAPPALTDDDPGPSLRIAEPGRPANLRFSHGAKGAKMPKDEGFNQARCRGVAHHVMANHELQAIEVMAWVLLAFPQAPSAFRRGLAHVLCEEQAHTQWHIDRAAAHGIGFGDVRVAGYVWRRNIEATSVLDYLACLPLTFEAANLDHSAHYAALYSRHGDDAGAAVMRDIHDDEIRHVGFGLHWLRRLKDPQISDWEAYRDHLRFPLRPDHARGRDVDVAARAAAGFDEPFVASILAADDPVGPTLRANLISCELPSREGPSV